MMCEQIVNKQRKNAKIVVKWPEKSVIMGESANCCRGWRNNRDNFIKPL